MATNTQTKSKTPAAARKADVSSSADAGQLNGTKIGVVESDKRDKTRKVVVNYLAKHPKYGKYIRQRTTLQVHDERNESRTGDMVEVAPCRPLSKTKSWRLVRVVDKRADVAAAIQSAKEVQ